METVLGVIKSELEKKLDGHIKFNIKTDKVLFISLDHSTYLPLYSIIKSGDKNSFAYCNDSFIETRKKFVNELRVLKNTDYKNYICKLDLFREYIKVYKMIRNTINKYLGG